jgi:hypothetical protein
MNSNKCFTQTLPYSFSQASGTYTALTGGTSWQSGATIGTNAISGSITIPFTFTFNGTGYTSLYISNNGFIAFGATTPSTTTYNPISASTAYAGAIAGYGFNLINSAVSGAAPDISYGTYSTSPNREFVIQFTDVARTGITGDRMSFQIRLAETTNDIKVVYNNWAATSTTTTATNFGVVGLRGATNTVFSSRMVFATSPYNTWISSGSGVDNGSTPSVTAPAINTSSGPNCVYYNSSYLPANGLTYTWSPIPSSFYQSLPYAQTFESWSNSLSVKDVPAAAGVKTTPATGNLCWRNYNEAIANSLWSGTNGRPTLGASQQTGAASFYNYGAPSGTKGYMDVYLNFSTAGTKSLSFDLINPDPGTLKLYLSTDGGATFGTALATYNSTVSSWTTQTISSLSVSTSSTCVLRFEATSTYGSYNIGVDNLSITVVAPCTTPTVQPSSLVLSSQTVNSINGSFTAVSPSPPSGYVVFRSTSSTAPTLVDGTTYTAGTAYTLPSTSYTALATSGTGPVTFSATGLTANTQYYFHIFSYNNTSCSGGPKYYTTTPLTGNTNTCPAAPTALAVTGGTITSSGAIVTWTAPAGGAVALTYTVQYRINGGSGWTTASSSATSPYAITGLSASTAYDIQVFASNATCSGAAVSTNSLFTTLCNAITSIPWNDGFESLSSSGATIYPACWKKENGDWTSGTASSHIYNDPRAGTYYIYDAYSATNEYIWTPGFSLTGGTSYDFSFWFAGDGYTGWTGDVFQNTSQISTSATQLGASFITSGTTSTTTYAQVTRTFVPSSTGTYYFGVRVNANSTPWYIGFDDFRLELTPTPCTTPTVQPSSLVLSSQTVNSINGSFTAVSPSPPSGYVVFRSTSSTAPTLVDGTTYTAGTAYTLPSTSYTALATSGTGPVTFSATGLTANTQYYFHIFSYNNTSCSGGPKYYTTTPLTGNTNTCPAAPTALAVTGGTITSSGAIVTWTAPAGGAVALTYTVQYRINGGSGWTTASSSATSPYAITGLSASTAYDIQVFASNATCSGATVSTNSLFTTTGPPPANNDCASAQTITPGLTCSSTNGTTVNSTQDGPAAPAACPSTSLNDVWYSFTADGTSDYTINVTNTAGDMVVQLFSNTCASPTSVSCADIPSIGTETISAGVLSAGTYRYRVYPYNGANAAFTTCVTYTVPFNPCTSIANLTCGSSVSPTIASGTGVYNLTNCYYGGTPGKEVIYTFTPTTTGTHYINQTSSFDYIDYMFKASSGGCSGSGWTCIEDLDGAATSVGFNLTAGTQYYILLDPEVTTGGSVSFSITCPTPPPTNDECAAAITLTPGAAGAACSPTAGNTNAATESPYGCLNGYPDDDVWYKFVATATSHTVTVDGAANFDAVVAVFTTDCSASFTTVTGGDCSDGDNTYSDGIETLTLTGLTIGNTYYVNVYDWWDDDAWFGYTKGGDFTICITTPPSPPNDNCAGVISITPTEAGVACSPTAGSSVGGTDSNVGCDDGNEDDDVWYSFTAVATSHIVNVDGSSSFRPVVGVYTSCGATVTATGGTCYTAASTGDAVALTLTALSVGATYYVKVHNYNNGGGTFTICVTTPDNVCPSGPPLNDEPCNAVEVVLGSIASGNNACATTSNEPSATPACWSTGTRNTVWYSFIAPTGGNVKVRTAPGSLRNTQIAVYVGTCGSGLTLLGPGCNDDAPDCGATDLTISELSFTSLTTGTRYYISVDGNGNSVGSFAITVINSASSYPTSSGQECSVPITVCNTRIQVGNPGYQGIGFTCDAYSTIVNCTTGERGSVWYKIDIAMSGTLLFDIVPNDYDPLNIGDETDYDFVLWKVAGTGATTCSLINSSGGDNEIRCNYSADGATGLSLDGSTPSEYPGYLGDAYETGVAVTAGESYLLVVQNFSNSLSGFDLDFKNTGPGVINTSTPASVTWTGGSNNTIWDNTTNWGGCTTPSCNINGVVSPSSAFQPTVTSAMGTINVKNLTIDPGATLTLGPNAIIKVCENLTNNGTIVAHPSSTILFNDNVTTHTITGTLSGSSSIGNLIITDIAGGNNCTVIANTDVEINGNFTTTDANSIFDLNGNNLLLNGNFYNAAGSTTFANTAGSTIYFNGTSSQSYSPNTVTATPSLTLNNVVINNSGMGVTISTTNTPNMILGTSGILTLTAGKIITPGNQEVIVTNTANAAVTTGNTSSYIQGNLRRYLAAGATGSFDFPVGNAAVGYERANINFTTAAAAVPFNLFARFNSWGGAFPMPGAPGWGPECYVNYNLPYLDNGYWTIDASAATTGIYTASLYNLGYTNISGANGWSIAKSPSSAPDWALNGLCAPTPSPTPVIRTAMTGFSDFSTIQSSSPLPVELAAFNILCENGNGLISWATASEFSSKEFIIERSSTGNNFEIIGTVSAAGNSNSYRNYSFTDFNVLNGQAYYRLKMVDFDGTYKYSSTLELDCEKQLDELSAYYSGEQGLVIKSQVNKTDNYSIEIYDMIGKRLTSDRLRLEKGSSLSFLKINKVIADGVYLIRINNSNGENLLTQKIWIH